MRARGELIRATKPYAQDDWLRSWWHLGSTLAVLLALLGATCLDMSWLLRLPFSLAASLVMVRLFVLYHDFLHGAILRRSWLADTIFSIYGLLIATPPSIWKHSHNHHHHHNGRYFETDVGTFPLMTTEEYAQSGFWRRMRYALERHPGTMLLGYVTIFLYSMCVRHAVRNPREHFDAGVALVLQAAIITTLAIFAPMSLLFTFLIPVMAAGALGSYLFYAQHNFPAACYRDRQGWDYVAAALHSSSFMRLNSVLHWFTGNIGYHHVHHLNARIPFYRLPEAMASIKELQTPGTTSLHPWDVCRCLRLKLWDPSKNRLVSFGEWRRGARRRALARTQA